MAILCSLDTQWHLFYIFSELLIYLILLIFFLLAIKRVYTNYQTLNYDRDEVILLTMSATQIMFYLILILTKNFRFLKIDFFVMLFLDILIFTQNAIFCRVLLFHLFLWNNYSHANKLKKYFNLVYIIDILAFLSGVSIEFNLIPLYNDFTGGNFNCFIFLAVMGGSLDVIILLFLIYKLFDSKTNITFEEIKDDTYSLNGIINNYKLVISHLKLYYSLIVLSMLIAYMNNLFLKLFCNNN